MGSVFLGPNPLGPLDLGQSNQPSVGPNRVFLGPDLPAGPCITYWKMHYLDHCWFSHDTAQITSYVKEVADQYMEKDSVTCIP